MLRSCENSSENATRCSVKVFLTALLFAVILLGTYLRFSELGFKPLQFDEGVNWFLAKSYLENGAVPYQDTHFHGPLFFKLMALFGVDSEVSLRLVSVVSGFGTILLAVLIVLNHKGGKNKFAQAICVAAFLGFDPILLFYNRAAIHESLFSFLTLSFWFLVLRFSQAQTLALALSAGVVLGLLAATKETFVFPLISAAIAIMFLRDLKVNGETIKLFVCFFTAAVISCALVFGQLNAGALIGSGVWEWGKKGFTDETQLQPLWFFVSLILKTSPLILVALFLFPIKNREVQYWIITGFSLLLLYSLIPYKTQWLLITVLPPIYIALACSLSKRAHILAALVIVGALSFRPVANEFLVIDDTHLDVKRFSDAVVEKCNKVGESCKVFVGARWYWPLPFYLRSLNGKVNYAEGPKAIPLFEYDAVILDANASIEPLGWSRKEFQLSRVQRLALYIKN